MAVLTDEEVKARLADAPGWEQKGDAIEKVFEFGDFSGSVGFVDRLTPVANELNHHPDLAISWNKVTATLSTHSEGGLTGNDFTLAQKLDELA
jgi:4a-hydroxytetrahydrobiopterin dehydratase